MKNEPSKDVELTVAEAQPARPRIRHSGPDKHPLILKAAQQLVAQVGFRDVQMSAVAEAAGIAMGTLYRYFPSKTELMMEVVTLTAQREVDVVAGTAMADGTAAERLGTAAWTFAMPRLARPETGARTGRRAGRAGNRGGPPQVSSRARPGLHHHY